MALNPFAGMGGDMASPSSDGVAITPSDTVDLAIAPRRIWSGSGGNIAIITLAGTTLTYTNVPAGVYLQIRPSRIKRPAPPPPTWSRNTDPMNGPVTITTVLEAAESYDLATLDDVKGDLGITTTTDDAYLQRRIAEMSQVARQYMNRTLQVETVRDQFWLQRDPYPWQVPGGAMPLQLSRWPVVAVTLLVENDIELVEGTDFVVDAEVGQLTRMVAADPYPSLWKTLPITVEYSAGFEPIPPDVSGAVSRAVKGQYMGRSRDPAIKSQSAAGIYTASYIQGGAGAAGVLTPDVYGVLDGYRIPVIA
jgi:hypothetical protein